MIQKNLIKKTLVFGIVVLFVGASVTPSIYGADLRINNLKNIGKGDKK